MKEQLMLLSLAMLAVLWLTGNSNFGNPFALSLVGVPSAARNFFSETYERIQIVFEKEAEDLKKEFKEGFEKYKGEIKTIVDELKDAGGKKASKEDLELVQKNLEKKIDEIQDLADDLQTKANRLKDQAQEARAKSLMGLAEDGLVSLKETTKANGGLKSLPHRNGKDVDIDLKAVSNMTTAYGFGVNASTLRAFEREPGIAKDPNTPLFVSDIITTGVTDSHTIEWIERILIEGGAAQVAEAAKFSQISTKWGKGSATSKKTAAYAKITEEMIEDTEYVLGEVQDEIISGPNSIRVMLENQLLTGDGTGENHTGLYTYATPFAVPNGFETLTNPNSYDASEAIVLQAVKANFNPNYMLVNPSTLSNMKLTKDGQGAYIVAPFVTQAGLVISGVRVAANNRIAEGSFLVGDFTRAKLLMKRQLTLKFFDQNEDDGLYDIRTVSGSLRAVFRVKTPDRKAFIKGTFAAVKTAIKTV